MRKFLRFMPHRPAWARTWLIAVLLLGSDLVGRAPAAVRLVLIDGRTEEAAAFEAVENSAIRLPDGREVDCNDLRSIEPAGPPAFSTTTPETGIEVRLSRPGGWFPVREIQLANEVCTATRHNGAAWRIALDDLRALKLDRATPPESFQQALAQPPAERDLLFARLAGSVTTIDGFVESIAADAVSFEWMNEARKLPREKLYGVIFARIARETPAAPRFVVELLDGGRLPADSMSLTSATDVAAGELQAHVVLSAATTIDLPWKEVRRVQVRSDRVRFLSDLMPDSTEEKPIVALPRRWQADHCVTGAPLRAGTESFEKGLGVQSGTTLTYKLGGEWSDFAAVLALDPATGGSGDCVFVVRGDGRELLRQPLRGPDAPHPVRLDVTGVDRLELVVEYGGDLDFGDHASWCDARLIRAQAAGGS